MSKAKEQKNLIVGLDIGTSKIIAIVAEVLPEGRMEIIGMGNHPSRGLKKGVVVNIESTVNAIQRALEEAELMADCKIREVYTGIAGSHIKGFNSHGMVAIKDKEVTQADVDRVIETARAVNARLIESYEFESTPSFPNPMPAKAACRVLGLSVGQCRLPLGEAPPELDGEARRVLTRLGTAHQPVS